MSVVGLKIAGQSESGWLWLDAGGAEASHDPNTPKNVLTDVSAPLLGGDNIWNLKFGWDPNKVATATIGDATSANVGGPQMLKMNFDLPSLKYNGVVLGRNAGMAPKWNIAAAGPIADLSSIPVRLWLNLPPSGAGNPAPCYLAPALSPPPAQGVIAGQFGEFDNAPKWTLEPFQTSIPPAVYTGLVVETYTVQRMLVDIWTKCVGTEWGKTFAGTLLAWMYDYPATWYADANAPNGVNPIWATHVKARIYDNVYGPYFVQNKTGFGEGNPPDADPPPRTGGRPPHKPR